MKIYKLLSAKNPKEIYICNKKYFHKNILLYQVRHLNKTLKIYSNILLNSSKYSKYSNFINLWHVCIYHYTTLLQNYVTCTIQNNSYVGHHYLCCKKLSNVLNNYWNKWFGLIIIFSIRVFFWYIHFLTNKLQRNTIERFF